MLPDVHVVLESPAICRVSFFDVDDEEVCRGGKVVYESLELVKFQKKRRSGAAAKIQHQRPVALNEIPDVALLSREADHRAVGGQPPILSPVLESLPPDLQDEPEVLDAEEGWDPVVGGESGIPGHPGLLAHGQDVPLDSLREQYH